MLMRATLFLFLLQSPASRHSPPLMLLGRLGLRAIWSGSSAHAMQLQ